MEIQLENETAAFLPGETVKGSVSWSLGAAPEAVEIRLIWFVIEADAPWKRDRPKEDPIVRMAGGFRWDQPGAASSHAFEIPLPVEPWSYQGTQFSVAWGLEAVALPNFEFAQKDLVVGPERQPAENPFISIENPVKRMFAMVKKFRAQMKANLAP